MTAEVDGARWASPCIGYDCRRRVSPLARTARRSMAAREPGRRFPQPHLVPCPGDGGVEAHGSAAGRSTGGISTVTSPAWLPWLL